MTSIILVGFSNHCAAITPGELSHLPKFFTQSVVLLWVPLFDFLSL